MDEQWDVVVVGGGPAGLSAALMLGRARRRVLLVDAGSPRNRFAAHMHGVLGNEGVDPAELLRRGRAEVAGYGVEVREGAVQRVDDLPPGLTVRLDGGATVLARAVVAATGLTDELPDVPGLTQRWGSGVLHCPYCHGWEVRDGRLGVLATSPLSLHQAELVRQWSHQVVFFAAGHGPLDEASEHRLRARGIEVVATKVAEVLGEGDRVTGVRLDDGEEVALDALFTGGRPRPHDGFLAHLELERVDRGWGRLLAVDATGRTSHERIWAVGNLVDPAANVPMAIAAGAAAGAAVNVVLVGEDFDQALARGSGSPQPAPAEYWEGRYTAADRIWSGRVNKVLSDIATDLVPGTALDLGCGEGADVIWLAGHGWDATGVDISPTAIQRATVAASQAGVAERARFVASDISDLPVDDQYDLVTASFLHSPVELARAQVLRRAADRVKPGGHLLIVAHGAPPPWADAHAHAHELPTPQEELATLSLDPDTWQVRVAEARERDATSPSGEPATLQDVVVLARRSDLPARPGRP